MPKLLHAAARRSPTLYGKQYITRLIIRLQAETLFFMDPVALLTACRTPTLSCISTLHNKDTFGTYPLFVLQQHMQISYYGLLFMHSSPQALGTHRLPSSKLSTLASAPRLTLTLHIMYISAYYGQFAYIAMHTTDSLYIKQYIIRTLCI